MLENEYEHFNVKVGPGLDLNTNNLLVTGIVESSFGNGYEARATANFAFKDQEAAQIAIDLLKKIEIDGFGLENVSAGVTGALARQNGEFTTRVGVGLRADF